MSDCNVFYEGIDAATWMSTPTNFVVLQHRDRTYSLYSHLDAGSIIVRRDDEVKQGEDIAKTGKSGWIGIKTNEPSRHLHFEAFAKDNLSLSRPVVFLDYDGPLGHGSLEHLLYQFKI